MLIKHYKLATMSKTEWYDLLLEGGWCCHSGVVRYRARSCPADSGHVSEGLWRFAPSAGRD